MHSKPRTYSVYILGSSSGTLYIGITSNLNKRIFQYKFHKLEGFTDRFNVERLLYYESSDDVHRSIAREKQLKGWRRGKKIALFEKVNPLWLDLARDWYPWMTVSGGGRGASTPTNDSLREPIVSAQHDKLVDSGEDGKNIPLFFDVSQSSH